MNFSENHKVVRHSSAVAAGVTTITPSSGVDTKGYNNCAFLVAFGAIVTGAATSIEVHQSDDDGVGDGYSALAGSKVTVTDADDNKIAMVEVCRPQKRYVKCIVNRATQNSTVDGIVAILSEPRDQPATHDSSTVVTGNEIHQSPSEGTA